MDAVPRSGLDIPRAALSISNPTTDNDIKFTGWEITDPTQLTNTVNFAMVVAFNWTTATVININSISLQKGDLPTRPAAQTQSDVLSQCQQYYETSYDYGVQTNDPATNPVTSNGACFFPQYPNTGAGTFNGRGFPIRYETKKRVPSTVTLYSPATGAINNVSVTNSTPTAGAPTQVPDDVVSTFWTQQGNGDSGSYFAYKNNGAVKGGAPGGLTELFVTFHFVADSRLGVV